MSCGYVAGKGTNGRVGYVKFNLRKKKSDKKNIPPNSTILAALLKLLVLLSPSQSTGSGAEHAPPFLMVLASKVFNSTTPVVLSLVYTTSANLWDGPFGG